MLKHISSLMVVVTLVSGCGGDGGGDTSCDTALTVNYIRSTIVQTPVFTVSNTAIVHTDGNQGNTYDINGVAVARTAHDMNASLAFAYSIYGSTRPPSGTYTAFYLDTDKNAGTGMAIGTMGADALVLHPLDVDGILNGFYLWNGSSWNKQAMLGNLISRSYAQGCTYSTLVYMPFYSGLSDLYGTDVTGIVMIITILGSDPTVITSIIDSSSQFDFTVP